MEFRKNTCKEYRKKKTQKYDIKLTLINIIASITGQRFKGNFVIILFL